MNEIDLGVWCRRIALVAILLATGFVGLKIGATFWRGWSLGGRHWEEASRTVTKCATEGTYDTKHFRRSCEEAATDLAKDPLIFAIEHTWERLWPCETALCSGAVVYLTRSVWTILAVSTLLSLAVLYFTGCSGPSRAPQQLVWSPPTHCYPPTTTTNPNSCIVDVHQFKKHPE